MKTLAIRLEDEVHALLSVVAQLEGSSIIAVIREAIDAHLERKASAGELADRAKAALDDIDRDASQRKAAIETMIGKVVPATPPAKRGRGKGPESEAEEQTLGFAPPPSPRRRGTRSGEASK